MNLIKTSKGLPRRYGVKINSRSSKEDNSLITLSNHFVIMLIKMCHVVWYSPDLFIAVIYLSLSSPLAVWITWTVHTWSIFYYIIKQQPISDCSLIELIDMHLLSCILHKSFLFLYLYTESIYCERNV